MAKDAKGHGSNAKGTTLHKPLADHPYHGKTNDELHYIVKDAGEAARAAQSMGKNETKYADQVNDAHTVLGYRGRVSDGEAKSTLAGGGNKSADVADNWGSHNAMYGSRASDGYRNNETKTVGRHGYNPDSVNKAIKNASRFQGKVGGKEASAIHRLLRGRG